MKTYLKDICEFYNGTGFPTVYQGKQEGKYPFYKVGDISKNVQNGYVYLSLCDNYVNDEDVAAINGTLIPEGTIVFAKIGEALKLNRRAITSKECLVDNNAIAIKPNTAIVDLDYFYFFMKRIDMAEYSSSTTVPSVKKSALEKIAIILPPLDNQSVISKELSNISEAIKAKNNQLIEFDNLIKSRFIEMFGDVIINSNNYELTTYGELFELNAGGTPSKKKSEYWENGTISWIGSNLCQNTILYENDNKYITDEGFKNSSARMFPIDTVLIALVGATIGKTALLKFETTTNQNVLGVRGISESGNNPYFVFYYTQELHSKFIEIGDGGFAMASKAFVSSLPFPKVSITIQNEFADFVKLIDKSKFIVQKQIDDLQELLDSKMDEYFG